MKTLILIGAMLVFSFSVSAKDNPDLKWVDGGTLYKAPVSDWNKATVSNQLATVSGWLTSTDIAISLITKDPSSQSLKLLALEVLICVDELAHVKVKHDKTVNVLGALCFSQLGIEVKE